MAKPSRYPEHMLLRCPPGTFARVDALLADGQDRASFIRSAIESAIRQRRSEPATAQPEPAAEVGQQQHATVPAELPVAVTQPTFGPQGPELATGAGHTKPATPSPAPAPQPPPLPATGWDPE